MTNRILVAYSSRTGSTAEVAEAIGQSLKDNGLDVDVRPMEAVADLTPYGAVVAGSAIRGGKWLPEAMAFLRANRSALSHRPFAAFLVCMTMAMRNAQYRAGVREWLAPVRALARPVSEGYFAGRLDFDKAPFSPNVLLLRITAALGVMPHGDHRDWAAIRTWAETIRPLLSQ